MKKAPLLSFRYFFYDFIRLTGWPLLIFFRPKKIYISKEAKRGFKGGFILMANHNSMKDPFYLIVCLFYALSPSQCKLPEYRDFFNLSAHCYISIINRFLKQQK